MKTLKVEVTDLADGETYEDVAAALLRFIGKVGNARRLHSAWGHLRSIQFEKRNARTAVNSAA